MAKRVMILATEGFEQSELEQPRAILEDEGVTVMVVSPQSGSIRGWKDNDWGRAVTVDLPLEEAESADFDALMLPGGQINPDLLRLEPAAIAMVRSFCDEGKPVAAICHAPWLLAEAGVLKGRTVTGWPSIRTDLRNAGAEVLDREVVVDGNLITSRKPDDIEAFTQALVAALAEERETA